MDATSKGKDDANYVTRDSSMLHVTEVNLIKLLLFFFSCIKFTSVVLFSWIYRVKNSLFTLVPWSPIFSKFPNAVENLLTAGQVHVCQNLCAALNKGVGVGGIVSVKKKSIITLTTWDSLWTFPKCTSIFEVKATIAINKVTILKNKATIALLFDSRATKTKAAIRICQSFLGTFSIMPPPPHFAAKSHFYGCTVILPVTSSTAYAAVCLLSWLRLVKHQVQVVQTLYGAIHR